MKGPQDEENHVTAPISKAKKIIQAIARALAQLFAGAEEVFCHAAYEDYAAVPA
jgi:hypothetical protein